MSKFKKKEKKKFVRKNIRLKNRAFKDVDEFCDDEVVELKKSDVISEAGNAKSQKSDLILKTGRVMEVMSNHKCRVKIDGVFFDCTVSGRLKHINFRTRTIVAVGDFVKVDFSETPRVEEIMPRRNRLARFSGHNFQSEIILASNIDRIIITASYLEPALNLGLVDRYLCFSEIENLEAIVCINKIDLCRDEEELDKSLEYYENAGIKILKVSAETGRGIEDLKELLKNKDTVFSGHSGAGKSSLINKIQPGLNLRVSQISYIHGKGQHTTSSGKLIGWNFGGHLADTPGIKTFGLYREHKPLIPKVFPGFINFSGSCKFDDCTHTHEKICGVKQAVEEGEIPEERYNSYCRIWDSL
ncbi:MAG: ribosome small subunit-dependent GTPase A [Candidatus Cloacimonadota bacterium]|nr:MAG: ribosome small subunit-dependent GTPase A [Candidatus Cloacimonadota bacterium]